MNNCLTVLWRGHLDSCNYGCRYCPFAKRATRREMLDKDRASVRRWVNWVENNTARTFRIMFTPWGEGLVHAWYKEALIALSHLPYVQQVLIQTNGSSAWNWIEKANQEKLGLWITWHPSEISADDFCQHLGPVFSSQIKCSIGCVGTPKHIDHIEKIRSKLPSHIPMWINALHPRPQYTANHIERLIAIDPHFHHSLKPHPSRGKSCRTGASVISVDGDGDIRRCHFIDTVLGNIYTHNLNEILCERSCTKSHCSCYIGYAHLDNLELSEIYGDGLLSRIPAEQSWSRI